MRWSRGGLQPTKVFALLLLREVRRGEGLVIATSTEGQVSNPALGVLTALPDSAVLPLTPEGVARIHASRGSSAALGAARRVWAASEDERRTLRQSCSLLSNGGGETPAGRGSSGVARS